MLEIYPIKDENILAEEFKKCNMAIRDGAAGYIAYDKGEAIGSCVFIVDKQTDLLNIEPSNDRLLCDSFIRAAINYSANRGVYKIVCATELTKSIATDLAYIIEGTDEIDIAGMMQGCKNCKKV